MLLRAGASQSAGPGAGAGACCSHLSTCSNIMLRNSWKVPTGCVVGRRATYGRSNGTHRQDVVWPLRYRPSRRIQRSQLSRCRSNALLLESILTVILNSFHQRYTTSPPPCYLLTGRDICTAAPSQHCLPRRGECPSAPNVEVVEPHLFSFSPNILTLDSVCNWAWIPRNDG